MREFRFRRLPENMRHISLLLQKLKEAGTLYEKVQKWRDGNVKNRVVISLYGGSGSGKTTLATALQQYFLK